MLIEYPDPQERSRRLTELRAFERRCWMQIAGFEPVYAIADEDLPRENATKTSPCISCALHSSRPAPRRSRVARRSPRASTLRPTPRASILSPPRCARIAGATLSDSFC